MKGWKEELDELLQQERQQREDREERAQQRRNVTEQNRKKGIEFVNDVCLRAFRELEKEFQERTMPVELHTEPTASSISIQVGRQGPEAAEIKQFQYAVNVSSNAYGIEPEVVTSAGKRRIQKGDRPLGVGEITKDDVIRDFMQAYRTTFSFQQAL
jgi:hypothetical protein